MKKASAIVVYNPVSNQIYNLTINHKGNLINMIHYELNGRIQPYKYGSFKEVYETVLSFAKNNGFYYGKYEQFGMEWFDIAWIDISNPAIVNKYGYRRNEA